MPKAKMLIAGSTLDLCKIARSQGKSARVYSGLTEGEVALAASKEGRPLSAEVSWSENGRFCVSRVYTELLVQ
ncbi:hypothetical protein HY003_00645 [Candidatus Saccharibacteria bacterium]|nr:hypothetical protein [Candidatus Saccharibacteria bacterium]MBI3337791.1 hypothetical protein [Candidatus Saccharibacteria bacterium]